MEDRVATLKRILGQTDTQVQELTSELQAQHAETMWLQAEVRSAATATTPAGTPAGGWGGVDTHMLENPDGFRGGEATWRDRSTVMRERCGEQWQWRRVDCMASVGPARRKCCSDASFWMVVGIDESEFQWRSLFERAMMRYEMRASETISLNQRLGMVLIRLDSGPLKDHLLLKSSKCYFGCAQCGSSHALLCGRTW